MLLGLRTVIYPARDLGSDTKWFTALVGHAPSFSEPYYVGFDVGGYELGLDPDASPADGAVAYWGVEDLEATLAALLESGARERGPIREVGGGIRVASVLEPSGSILGLIVNPHFKVGETG